jgi:hypothetical protein
MYIGVNGNGGVNSTERTLSAEGIMIKWNVNIFDFFKLFKPIGKVT